MLAKALATVFESMGQKVVSVKELDDMSDANIELENDFNVQILDPRIYGRDKTFFSLSQWLPEKQCFQNYKMVDSVEKVVKQVQNAKG